MYKMLFGYEEDVSNIFEKNIELDLGCEGVLLSVRWCEFVVRC